LDVFYAVGQLIPQTEMQQHEDYIVMLLQRNINPTYNRLYDYTCITQWSVFNSWCL